MGELREDSNKYIGQVVSRVNNEVKDSYGYEIELGSIPEDIKIRVYSEVREELKELSVEDKKDKVKVYKKIIELGHKRLYSEERVKKKVIGISELEKKELMRLGLEFIRRKLQRLGYKEGTIAYETNTILYLKTIGYEGYLKFKEANISKIYIDGISKPVRINGTIVTSYFNEIIQGITLYSEEDAKRAKKGLLGDEDIRRQERLFNMLEGNKEKLYSYGIRYKIDKGSKEITIRGRGYELIVSPKYLKNNKSGEVLIEIKESIVKEYEEGLKRAKIENLTGGERVLVYSIIMLAYDMRRKLIVS